MPYRVLYLLVLIGCEAVQLHPCAQADCGLFPEVGVDDGRVDDGGASDGGLTDGAADSTGGRTGRINLIDRETAQPISGAQVTVADITKTTDGQGRVSYTFDQGLFELRVDVFDRDTHRLVGHATDTDFEQLLFIWSPQLWDALLLPHQKFYDARMAQLVVGLIDGRGQPAVGAQVQVSSANDGPLTIQRQTTREAVAIAANDEAWVLFPNTLPGRVEIAPVGPDGQPCLAFPGRVPLVQLELLADEVTTVIYLCESP
ncbi:MAG: hypothetical protein VX589_00970 [Myxococcota bacterium]|nr:hypothetical protein [Myxococcota bacterium]